MSNPVTYTIEHSNGRRYAGYASVAGAVEQLRRDYDHITRLEISPDDDGAMVARDGDGEWLASVYAPANVYAVRTYGFADDDGAEIGYRQCASGDDAALVALEMAIVHPPLRWHVSSRTTGHSLGVWAGASPSDALAAMYAQAGYCGPDPIAVAAQALGLDADSMISELDVVPA